MYSEFFISKNINTTSECPDRFCYKILNTIYYREIDKELKEFVTVDSFVLKVFNHFNFNGRALLSIEDKNEMLEIFSEEFQDYINYINNNINFIVTYDDNALVLYYTARIKLIYKEDFDVKALNKEIEDIYLKKDYLHDDDFKKEMIHFLNIRLDIFKEVINNDFDNKKVLLAYYIHFIELLKEMFYSFYKVRVDKENKSNNKI